jgi:hypothetical protein
MTGGETGPRVDAEPLFLELCAGIHPRAKREHFLRSILK